MDRALADPRVVDRALREPAFLELVLADPKLGVVVAAANFRLPLPEDRDARDRIRASYRLVGPPPSPGAIGMGSDTRFPPQAPRPLGFYGTRTHLSKPNDPDQQKAAKLLKDASVPGKRISLFQEAWKKLRFMGWQVNIREVKTVDGKTIIKATVHPIAEDTEGMRVEVVGYVEETYQLEVGNKLKLLNIDGSAAGSGWMRM